MPTTTDLHLGVGIDTRSFSGFARALRKAAPELDSGLKLRLRAAGHIVADEASEDIARVSIQVPPTVKVRVAGAGVSVIAGGSTPLAGLFELGNQGSGGDTFRHPVFGNASIFVDQAMHPFLGPAVENHAEDVFREVLGALDDAITTATREDL